MLLNLHYLRVLAALAVVYFHTTSPSGLNLPVNIGSHGVDLFFVISGFIITYMGVRSPDRFLLRRLIRIVPFYWTATLTVFVAAALAPHVFRNTRPDYVQLVYSLLFIPHRDVNGDLFPTLILGWSLNYEMYFYVLFQAALLISRRAAPMLCGLAITAIALLAEFPGVAQSSIFHLFYGRTVVFEFVLGICAYYVIMAAQKHSAWFTRRPFIRWVLIAAAAGAVGCLGVEEYHDSFGLARGVAAGLPAFALLLSVLMLERVYGASVKSKLVFLAGESSYILYLIHPYLVFGVLRTVFATGRDALAIPTQVALITGLLLATTLAAILIHLVFERPLLAGLRKRLLEGNARPGEARAAPGIARG